MTWCGTGSLFVKIFCLQNKSDMDSSNACFSTFASSAVQVTWLESSLHRKTEGTVSVFHLSFCCFQQKEGSLKHEPCTSRYMACVHSRCAMKLVHLELLVWTQTRGKKLCFLWLSASSLRNTLLLLLAGITWKIEIWRLRYPYGACKFALCSVNFAAVVLEIPPVRAIPLA